MSSPLAVIGLTYGGEDLQRSDLSLFLEITQGLNEPPQVRGVDVVVPAADGRIPRPRRRDRLSIILTGSVMGVGADEAARLADFRTTAEYVRGLFHPAGDPDVIQATLETAVVVENTARPLNVMWNQTDIDFAIISVELESVVPSWTVV